MLPFDPAGDISIEGMTYRQIPPGRERPANAVPASTIPKAPGTPALRFHRESRRGAETPTRKNAVSARNKVTNPIAGLYVKPESKAPGDLVARWVMCDPRYDRYTSRFQKMFIDKPHLPRP